MLGFREACVALIVMQDIQDTRCSTGPCARPVRVTSADGRTCSAAETTRKCPLKVVACIRDGRVEDLA
jgi:hypothetical protein